jgi:hypothetical protein
LHVLFLDGFYLSNLLLYMVGGINCTLLKIIPNPSLFDVCILRSQGKNSTERPTATADRKFLGSLQKKHLKQQFSSKKCIVPDDKDEKRAEVH